MGEPLWEEGLLIKDIRRQLRKGQGLIYWSRVFLEWLLVQLARLFFGCRLDVTPLAPAAFGTTVRYSSSTTVKWIPTVESKYSSEQYEVHVQGSKASTNIGAGVGADEWRPVGELQSEMSFEVDDLAPDTAYTARVRACNSKGKSAWRELSFRTKQQPVKGGGSGPGYIWTQDEPLNTLVMTIPVAKLTRAKELEVYVRPGQLRIANSGEVLLEGPLHAEVVSTESEWELVERDNGKDLVLMLPKKSENMPWPSIIRGHPEIDVRGLKRKVSIPVSQLPLQTLTPPAHEHKSTLLLARVCITLAGAHA